MGESLFKRLSDAHPAACAQLSLQYRMNADIVAISSRLVYENRLQCGSRSVASARLNCPTLARVCAAGSPAPAWLQRSVDPAHSVVWLDTAALPHESVHVAEGPEGPAQASVQNEPEVAVVVAVVAALVHAGVQYGEVSKDARQPLPASPSLS